MVNFKGRTDSKATHDAESLRKIVTSVRELLAPAIRLAGDPDDPKSSGAMQSEGVKNLEIYYFQSLERAMTELRRWGGACESAWHTMLMEKAFKGKGGATVKGVLAKESKPAKKAVKKKK
jgi:hypothetical protein